MGKKWRTRIIGLILIGCVGCNPLTAPFFFMYGSQSKHFAEFKLVQNRRTPVTVVVLTSYKGYVPEEFIGVERTLSSLFDQKLVECAALNSEVIKFIPIPKVEKYKSETPGWETQHPSLIGEHFKADFVIDLTITSMSMFDQGARHLYVGRGSISVEVYDAKKADSEPVFNSEYTCEFPPGRPVESSEMPIAKFRLGFLRRMATDLAWKFSDHLVEETYGRNDF